MRVLLVEDHPAWLNEGLLLDVDLPDGDGMAVLSEVRAGTAGSLPALLVSARDVLEDRVQRLNGGGPESANGLLPGGDHWWFPC